MAITEEQRLERRKYLGSSDISSIFECNPFITSYDVFLQKLYLTENITNDTIELGNELENVISIWTARQNNLKIIERSPEDLRYLCKKYPLFACNIDALASNDEGTHIIEAKYTQYEKEWGANGSTVIPQRVMLQAQHQCLCVGADRAYVGVWIADKGLMKFMRSVIKSLKGEQAGFECLLELDDILKDIDMRHYEIKRDQKIIDKIIDHCTWWWKTYVKTKTPPPMIEPPNIEIVKSIIRDSDKTAQVSARVVDEYEFSCVNFNAAKSEKDEAKAKLLSGIGDAQFYQYPNGKVFEYKEESSGEKINKELLKDRFPEIYDEVSYGGTRKIIREVNAPRTKVRGI